MCGCSGRREQAAAAAEPSTITGAVVLQVPDMACGHCAGAITRAIETAFPGTVVEADPVSKRVAVRGVADLPGLARAVRAAGYTPAPV